MSLISCIPYARILLLVLITLQCTRPFWTVGTLQATAQQEMDPAEMEALYEIMEGFNGEHNWRSLYPDPCINGPVGIFCLPDEVAGLYHVTNLEFGVLSEDSYTIPCDANASLSSSIGKLRFLESLMVFNCFFNASVSFPAEIGELSESLEMLTFLGNPKLGGQLPPGIANLARLQRLVIVGNSVTGQIPAEIGTMSSLLELDLSGNNLTDAIPDSLNRLANLVILDLGHNQLSGTLPSLPGLRNLQKLVLSHNELQGRLSNDFGALYSLTFVDLGNNLFSGPFPRSFANLSDLQDFSLDNANMSSPLPNFLGNLTKLTRLTLSNSKFVGEIPYSFGDMSNLHILILDNNELSGSVPAELGKLSNLYRLDLTANYLSGPLPFSTDFLLRLGHNLRVDNNSGLCTSYGLTTVEIGLSVCSRTDSDAPLTSFQQVGGLISEKGASLARFAPLVATIYVLVTTQHWV